MNIEERQQVVEFVVMHVATQGTYSYDDIACQYLDERGDRCVIGAMLSEEQCNEADINCYGVKEICEAGWNGWKPSDRHFLKCIQQAHDEAAQRDIDYDDNFLSEFRLRMQNVCLYFQLRYPEEYL
jgi:hypothetical protein